MASRTRRKTTDRHKPTVDEHHAIREHLEELKRRALVVGLTVVVGSVIAYALEQHLIRWLLGPARSTQFIYTSPMAGINFLFGVCLDIGVVLAAPVIVYQVLAFLRPVMRSISERFLLGVGAAALVAALAGVAFGYFVGLPSALHFLLSQFSFVGTQVKPMLSIQEYVHFVATYLAMSSLLFQLPLVVFIINRIRPLTPSDMVQYERHVTAVSVIAGFIMNPSPNLVDQLVTVVPMLLMYQVSIGMVWLSARRRSGPDRAAERAANALATAASHHQRQANEPARPPLAASASSNPFSTTPKPGLAVTTRTAGQGGAPVLPPPQPPARARPLQPRTIYDLSWRARPLQQPHSEPRPRPMLGNEFIT